MAMRFIATGISTILVVAAYAQKGQKSGQPAQSSPWPLSKSRNWRNLQPFNDRLQLRYPSQWLVTANVTDPQLGSEPVKVINLVSNRLTGSKQNPESQTVSVVVAAYAKRKDMPLLEWLKSSFRDTFLTVNRGRIQYALSRAYSGAHGLISFVDTHIDHVHKAELGSTNGGVLFYSGVVAEDGNPFVYVVELHLTLDKTAHPSDRAYASAFEDLLSTVRLSAQR